MTEKTRAALKKPFNPNALDPDEEALAHSFATDTWSEVTDPAERRSAMDAAKLSKSERTNIRLSAADLEGIKLKANERGLGYQTLIASLVHGYVSGSLLEIDRAVVEVAARAAITMSITPTNKGVKEALEKRKASGKMRRKKSV